MYTSAAYFLYEENEKLEYNPVKLYTLSTKWTEIIKEKLNIIMKLLDEVDTRLNNKIKLFEKQYKPYIEDLKKQIKEIEKDLEKEEENYQNMKKDIYEGVLEGLNTVI